MSKWIDYDKKKPKLYERVLISYRTLHGNFYTMIGIKFTDGIRIEGKSEYIKSSKSYWMKLPKEPKY